ncbi:MAG: methionine gamma-lyase family protein [Clostridia bacterium]|nr:methionine gamma-lyase family protein [Clostridia bacterium]
MVLFSADRRLAALDASATKKAEAAFANIERITEYNQQKVLSAFIECGVSEMHLGVTTGYGYDDVGRDTLDKVVAKAFGAQDALIRHSFASGTHTLSVALFGVLRPGDTVLSLTGRPYDTITGVFGIDSKTDGSLRDFGINYEQVCLTADGEPDIEEIKSRLKTKFYKMAYIQRSRGYSSRKSLSIEKIKQLCDAVKEISPDTVIMVDNCYGEFVEKREPTEVGADLMAGSLIKNPGGGIAPCGGYIAGKSKYIEMCAHRMTCAGVGREVGATVGHNRELYMGFFASPHTTGEALKTAVYASALFSLLGYKTSPETDEARSDIIEIIYLENKDALIDFCRGLQSGSPVDAAAVPTPAPMPGYDDEVIMAAGAFTGGASIELSADAPLREPYCVYMQGGLNFYSAKVGVLLAADRLIKRNAEGDKGGIL